MKNPVFHSPVLRDCCPVGEGCNPACPSSRDEGFYSPYFIVPKKGGGLQPILDLHVLNQGPSQASV